MKTCLVFLICITLITSKLDGSYSTNNNNILFETNSTTTISCTKMLSTGEVKYTADVWYGLFVTSIVTFKTFDDLSMPCAPIEKLRATGLFFEPNKRHSLLFPNRLDIAQLLKTFTLTYKAVTFRYLKGINLNPSNIPNSPNIINRIPESEFEYIMLDNVNVDFYLNETTLITAQYCSRQYFSSINTTGFVSKWSNLEIHNSFYTNEICPFAFAHTNLKVIYFDDISNSLIYKNRLRFMSINETDDDEDFLSTQNIQFARFSVAYEEITPVLLNRHVFRNLVSINLIGNIYRLQENIFKYLKYVKVVALTLDNFETFFSSDFAWLDYLNTNVYVSSLNTVSPINTQLVIVVQFEHLTNNFFSKDVLPQFTFPDIIQKTGVQQFAKSFKSGCW